MTKKTTLLILLASILFLCGLMIIVLLIIIRYRLCIHKDIILEREIFYPLIDLKEKDYLRTHLVESLLRNKRIFTINKNNQIEWFYVSKQDYELCWPESPLKMQENHYTLLVTLRVKKLILSGYTPAVIAQSKKIAKEPQIKK